MKQPRFGSHWVHKWEVHLMWRTKYRYKVLAGAVQLRCRELLWQTGNVSGVQILKGMGRKDPIQPPVSYPPSVSGRALMRRLKGRRAKLLLQAFSELKRW